MPYSPYEWNESVQQRNGYIEDRLKDGSPVSAIAYDAGLLLVTLRRHQRKIYEIYDRLMFAAVGNQSDIETIRIGAIDVAHQEGFTRSPDDVTIQRIVGFAVSPGIKKVYADPFAAPVVLRALFCEVGKTVDDDAIYVVSYDGEFSTSERLAAIAGGQPAEDRMVETLKKDLGEAVPSLQAALRAGITAWTVGSLANRPSDEDDEHGVAPKQITEHLKLSLAIGWQVEAGILERNTKRETRFRLIAEPEIKEALGPLTA
jgi:proteasome alpha subunit